MNKIVIDVEFDNEEQAMALAQFLKRNIFQQYLDNAVNEDEAYQMRDGASKVQDALVRKGFNPR